MSSRAPSVFRAILLCLLVLPSGATAQSDDDVRAYGRGALSLLAGHAVGEFAEHVGFGVGFDLAGSVFLGGSGRIALRAAVGGVTYGRERGAECGGRGGPCSEPRRTTINDISFLEVGPEYSWPLGDLRPFVYGTVGLASFVTTVKEKNHWWEGGDETQILGDYAGSLGVGAGLDVKVRGGRSPILLTVGGQYHRNGSARYLTKGAVVDSADGSLTFLPNVSQSNLVTFRIGVAFMFTG